MFLLLILFQFALLLDIELGLLFLFLVALIAVVTHGVLLSCAGIRISTWPNEVRPRDCSTVGASMKYLLGTTLNPIRAVSLV